MGLSLDIRVAGLIGEHVKVQTHDFGMNRQGFKLEGAEVVGRTRADILDHNCERLQGLLQHAEGLSRDIEHHLVRAVAILINLGSLALAASRTTG